MKRWLMALAFAAVACGGGEAGAPAKRQPLPSVADIRADLTGRPFDEFLERSFAYLLQRSPMWVVQLGLEDRIDVGQEFIDDLSDGFARETQDVEQTILDLARGYDREALSAPQRIAADAYLWYLDDRVRYHAFSDLDYRVTPTVNSVVINTELFFTDVHPFHDAADAERYVRRLGAVGTQIRQVRDVMKRIGGQGIFAPRLVLQWSRPGIRAVAQARARDTAFYQTLATKIAPLDLDAATRADLLDRAAATIAASIVPAYQELDDLIATQAARAPDAVGVWQYPNGDAYYAWALRHHITADATPDALFQLGMDELARIHRELDERFAALGYAAGAALAQQMARASADSGHVAQDQELAAYTAIIDDAWTRLPAAFDLLPSSSVVVKPVASGGFYVEASLDNRRPGIFFATVAPGGEDRLGMRTLAYHETVPGHHLQIGVAHDLPLPLFQRTVSFTGHAEGWGLYAEWLAGDLGWYAGDVYGDIGRLQYEAFRAARLVVDTGMHAKRWTFDQAVSFFQQNTGFSLTFSQGQITRYASWPGQATAYWMGRDEIRALRAVAEAALGPRFDLKAFHRAVLGHGSVPLDVLDTAVRADLGIP